MTSKPEISVNEKYRSLKNLDFIGPDEMGALMGKMQLSRPEEIPDVPFKLEDLESLSGDHILIWGCNKHTDGRKLTINSLRQNLGIDPEKSEPCFYNQDWYQREPFAEKGLESRWYLIKKEVAEETRAKDPGVFENTHSQKEKFPSAVLAAYVFFVYYFLRGGKMLWQNDFIWCDDHDSNGDRIYVGRYMDPKGINKNGFNIHRHLSLRPCYGAVTEILE